MQTVDSRFDSVWVKFAVIAALTLLMLWPLTRVESLVTERQARQHEASDVISAGFGGTQIPQTVELKVGQKALSVVGYRRKFTNDG
jgi:inner membrane protein involved in colicin E2 resistance